MHFLIDRIKEEIRQNILEIWREAEYEIFFPDPRHGDLATNAPFLIAKEVNRPPAAIAEDIEGSFEGTYVKEARAAGGFVNFFLNRELVEEELLKEISEGYGSSEEGAGKTIVIDYSSPNVAKPLHVGHFRSTLIGGSLYRVFETLGYRVVGINWLGDHGTQFGELIYAYKHWVDEEALHKNPMKELLRIYVKFHQEAEKNPELEEEARKILAELEKGKQEYVELWKKFRELTIKHNEERIYSRLGVKFDEITGESAYVEKAKEVVKELVEKGILEVWNREPKRGCVVANLERFGLDHPVFLKSDGATTYIARDLAALLDHWERYQFYKKIYVVGAEQKLHFQQLFKLLELMDHPAVGRCIHRSFSLIHLPEGKISTRKGRVIFMEDVMDKAVELAAEEVRKRHGKVDPKVAEAIGLGALVYAFLRVDPDKDFQFSYEKALAFEGDTGPYVQYSAVRARKIVEKAGGAPESFVVEKVEEPEWTLVREMLKWPEVLREVSYNLSPNKIAAYAYSLADKWNKFYEKVPVIGSGFPHRLVLAQRFYELQKTVLYHLLMKVPEYM